MKTENTAKGLRDMIFLFALLALTALVSACGLSSEEKEQNEYFKQTGQAEIYK